MQKSQQLQPPSVTATITTATTTITITTSSVTTTISTSISPPSLRSSQFQPQFPSTVPSQTYNTMQHHQPYLPSPATQIPSLKTTIIIRLLQLTLLPLIISPIHHML